MAIEIDWLAGSLAAMVQHWKILFIKLYFIQNSMCVGLDIWHEFMFCELTQATVREFAEAIVLAQVIMQESLLHAPLETLKASLPTGNGRTNFRMLPTGLCDLELQLFKVIQS